MFGYRSFGILFPVKSLISNLKALSTPSSNRSRGCFEVAADSNRDARQLQKFRSLIPPFSARHAALFLVILPPPGAARQRVDFAVALAKETLTELLDRESTALYEYVAM